mmetsp:Transcript_49262/g.114166  ORF Transcript_49262/g.114166 Transcript_49262/m.114166 type:complete len:265 (-) Transcript_49262:2-796(-)
MAMCQPRNILAGTRSLSDAADCPTACASRCCGASPCVARCAAAGGASRVGALSLAAVEPSLATLGAGPALCGTVRAALAAMDLSKAGEGTACDNDPVTGGCAIGLIEDMWWTPAGGPTSSSSSSTTGCDVRRVNFPTCTRLIDLTRGSAVALVGQAASPSACVAPPLAVQALATAALFAPTRSASSKGCRSRLAHKHANGSGRQFLRMLHDSPVTMSPSRHAPLGCGPGSREFGLRFAIRARMAEIPVTADACAPGERGLKPKA